MDGTHSCDDNVFVFYIMEWMALSDTVEVGQPNVRHSGVHVMPVVDHAECFQRC